MVGGSRGREEEKGKKNKGRESEDRKFFVHLGRVRRRVMEDGEKEEQQTGNEWDTGGAG